VVEVYAVPDVGFGDQVMAALVLRGDARFDTEDFAEFLRAQTDLAVKQWPRFVRISTVLPKTATHKGGQTDTGCAAVELRGPRVVASGPSAPLRAVECR